VKDVGDKPVKYLGLFITRNLDWGHQIEKLDAGVEGFVNGLNRKMVSMEQAILLLDKVLRPRMSYYVPFVPVSTSRVRCWDAKIPSLVKRKARAARSMSAQGLYTAAEWAGCGLLFLEALIPAAQTTEILTLLNGSSKGANIWKAVWRRQVNLGHVQRAGIGKGFMSPVAGEWLEGIPPVPPVNRHLVAGPEHRALGRSVGRWMAEAYS
jgi:hypothetical protein